MINYALIRTLEELVESDQESILINLEDQSKVFTFIWNPSNYEYAAANEYVTKYGLFGKKPHTRYRNSQVGVLTLAQVMFMTPCGNRNLIPLMNDLEKLRFPLEGKQDPPILSWTTGQTTIQPLYLQSLRVAAQELVNGQISRMSVDLAFIGADQITFA